MPVKYNYADEKTTLTKLDIPYANLEDFLKATACIAFCLTLLLLAIIYYS